MNDLRAALTMPAGSRITRRAALSGAAGLVVTAVAGSVAAQDRTRAILQPNRPGREAFMERAFEMRRLAVERGDQPYGAVIVKADRIVGEGASAVVTDDDPTAHAEMVAIRDAARRLGSRDLSGCEMYGTSSACPMCEAGAYWARITRLLHGAMIVDAGPPRLR
jgi:tRNA(Arg) A34 adenosine deaminase TadA